MCTSMAMQAEMQAQQIAEEQVFQQEMLARLAEQDRLEQLGDLKRRLRAAEHRQEVKRLIIDKRQRDAAAQVYYCFLFDLMTKLLHQRHVLHLKEIGSYPIQ